MVQTLNEFLSERKLIRRWIIFVAALCGAFFGAILMLLIALLGIIK